MTGRVQARGVAALAVALLAATGGATAQARPVASVSGSTLSIAGDGTAAALTIRPLEGGVAVDGAEPGPGCVGQPAGASCPTEETTVLRAALSGAPETLRGLARFAGATVEGGGGADTLVWAARSPATLRGGLGTDRLVAQGTGSGAVTLEGQDGGDRIELGERRESGDTAVGGLGIDRVSYAGRTTASLSLSLDATRNDGAAGEGDLLGTGIETLVAGGGDDRVTGNGFANTIDAGRGADAVDGGGGRDTLSYALAAARAAGVVADLARGTFPEGDTATGIENLTGSSGSDRLTGTLAAEALDGAGGDDAVLGSGGADALTGGPGRDKISFENFSTGVTLDLGGRAPQGLTFQGFEGVRGSEFGDVLVGTPAGERLDGRGGDDDLIGGPGTDFISGGDGRDRVSYDDGRIRGGQISRDPDDNLDGELLGDDVEILRGTAANDLLVGGVRRDRLEGAGGDDAFLTGPNPDEVDGGPGQHDEMRFTDQPGGASVRMFFPASGRDEREGDTWTGVEDITGSPAPDTVAASGDRSRNILRFGPGDSVSYALREDGVVVTPGGGADDGAGGEEDDVRAEIVEGSLVEDLLSDEAASAQPNRYVGGGGRDVFIARDVRDDGVLRPEDTPRDVFDGGADVDVLEWASPAPVRLSLIDRRGSYNDELLGIENLTGGDGDDSLVGDGGENELLGRGGDDVMAGLDGDDDFEQEPGADTYAGGGGGLDFVSYGDAAAGVSVTVDDQPGDGEPGEGDNVGSDVEEVEGSRFADRLSGGAILAGADGDDVLAVRPAGPAFLNGGPGTDTLDASGRTGGGLTLAAGVAGVAGDLGYDAFEHLIGTAGPDVLSGSARRNELRGGGGDDQLNGRLGRDLVLGGTGADTITDGDATADELGGSVLMAGASVLPDERAQSDATPPGGSVSVAKVVRDDRLIVAPVDPARRVVVDLAARRTDIGDVLADIESVSGTPGPDRLIGDGAENTLGGGAGDDVIEGGGQNDRLSGGDGADSLSDRSAERDALNGGAGDDFLDAVDAAAPTNGDSVVCGAGAADLFRVDLFDDAGGDCERAFAAPVGQHPLTRVRARSARVGARGLVRVLVTCPRRGVRRTCRGTVFVERGKRRRAKPRVIASRSYRLRAGRSEKLSLRLRRGARRKLARRGELAVRLAAREVDPEDRPRESSVPVALRARGGDRPR